MVVLQRKSGEKGVLTDKDMNKMDRLIALRKVGEKGVLTDRDIKRMKRRLKEIGSKKK